MSIQPRVWGMLSRQAAAGLHPSPQNGCFSVPWTKAHGSLSTASHRIASMQMRPHICVPGVPSVTTRDKLFFLGLQFLAFLPRLCLFQVSLRRSLPLSLDGFQHGFQQASPHPPRGGLALPGKWLSAALRKPAGCS